MGKGYSALIFLLFLACKKGPTSNSPQPEITIPTITTSEITEIKRTSALSGGSIDNDGGSSVTKKGICYNTSPSPTIASNIISCDTGSRKFSLLIPNLIANTKYYVRAFASNIKGTAYGNEISFTTQQVSTPTVITNNTVTTTSPFVTTSGGNVTDDGGNSIIARGICWSSLHTPTINDNKTIDGNGTGNFVSSVNILAANSTYFIRAYATNTFGVSYGEVVTIVTDVEGNIYNSVKIGMQTWMMENLRVTKFRDGNAIPLCAPGTLWGWPGPMTPKYCWYNDDINYKNVYGAIYNGVAVNTGLLSPSGWHVPSRDEFAVLIHFLDSLAKDTTSIDSIGQKYVYTRSGIAGAKLKEAGINHWKSPNVGATNVSGFTALPGGWRQSIGGDFAYLGENAGLWTSTPFPLDHTLYTFILSYWDAAIIQGFDMFQQGFSVRCIKDL